MAQTIVKDAALIVAFLLVVFVGLSWASSPSMVVAEQVRTAEARQYAHSLETRIALMPSPVPRACTTTAPYYSAC